MPKTVHGRRLWVPALNHLLRWLFPGSAARHPWYDSPRCIVGLALLVVILSLSFVWPVVQRCDPLAMNTDVRLRGPSLSHWLGTDQFGRDLWCRVQYGGRVSLPLGIAAVLAAVVPGLCLGMLAGYYGGWLDALVGRLADVMLAFPGVLLALLIVAWLGPGLGNVILAMGIMGIPNYVRVSRGSVRQLRRAWFVRAAYVVGCTDARIIMRHILPNLLPVIGALATLDVAWAILNAATLSFLGLGAQPPTPEWGALINEGRGYLRQAPWISLAPGGMIALTVMAITLFPLVSQTPKPKSEPIGENRNVSLSDLTAFSL